MSVSSGFTRFATLLAVVFAVLGFAASAHADSNSTRAARLTYVQGSVTVNQPYGGDSVPGQLNLPLLAGVQLVTGNDGQAEVEFEDGSVVRLTPNSTLQLESLAIESDGDFVTNLSLLRGLAYCELRATSQYHYAINAGGDILSPVENTTVRINFDQSPATFSVLDGTAQVERPNASSNGYQTRIRAGESLRADLRDGNRYFLSQQITEDSWDQWNDDRDQAAADAASDSTAVRNDYAGAQGYGWSDLDANGNWYNVPGQGTVWQPEDAIDDPSFDPYGNGAWVYYPNSGYIWASSYSWGWTPYRCGNWSYYNGFGWGWAPGPGCGSRGWGFGGGGRPVNIVIGPTGYRPIRVPVSGVPHPRPILPVMTTKAWVHTGPSHRDDRGPRQISGVIARPIERRREGPEQGGPASALRRDFPIDSRSKAPVLGLAGTRPVGGRTDSGRRQMDQRPNPTATGPYNPTPGQPDTYGGRRYPSNVPAAPPTATSQPSGARPDPPANTSRPDNPPAARPTLDRYNNRPGDNATPGQQQNQNGPFGRRQDGGTPNQPPQNQNPSNGRRQDNAAPNQQAPNQGPPYGRRQDNGIPNQTTPNQNPPYRRGGDNAAPAQPPVNQPPAAQNPPPRRTEPPQAAPAPPPPVRTAPPAERPVERPTPPPPQRTAPPAVASPPPQRTAPAPAPAAPAPSSPRPTPASEPRPAPGPPHASPN